MIFLTLASRKIELKILSIIVLVNTNIPNSDINRYWTNNISNFDIGEYCSNLIYFTIASMNIFYFLCFKHWLIVSLLTLKIRIKGQNIFYLINEREQGYVIIYLKT
jgi:hypothetical protein